MILAVDAMGGDKAPLEPCRGAIMACQMDSSLQVALVGDASKMSSFLDEAPAEVRKRIHLVHTDEFISMDESPSVSIRKKRNSSMRLAMEMVRVKDAEAVISAGNTGAIVAGGILVLGRIPGIDRPGLGVPIATLSSRVSLLLDVGATVRCKPINLTQFALMGSIYMKSLVGVSDPTVALLSNGEEDIKGDDVVLQAREMLKASSLNFVGYVEGKDVPLGTTDVVVCDGYTGNVLLKFGEGLGEGVMNLMKEEISKSFLPKVGLLFMLPMLKKLHYRFDYERHGGTPLLGVRGTVIKAHGRSRAKAICNALMVARDFVARRGVQTIEDELAKGGI
ncbi:fatty acid/phospholipid synthesis protein PlsX [Thermanaerovibrio velox DSM 12556]|uniref:Phosphate acyltransferase n=1 Tax=Thermanaerovibrio velox DSM 12556 TaxID=926567 RepID=H0US31_9BACT|nr:phosphate acyltransferase PlsX [Thermanaerovibrio velox]EHM10120.1 fatty acid/phospholipid synthesis protein PlsX [Thermanaerovibrio velox DSM 12556]